MKPEGQRRSEENLQEETQQTPGGGSQERREKNKGLLPSGGRRTKVCNIQAVEEQRSATFRR